MPLAAAYRKEQVMAKFYYYMETLGSVSLFIVGVYAFMVIGAAILH